MQVVFGGWIDNGRKERSANKVIARRLKATVVAVRHVQWAVQTIAEEDTIYVYGRRPRWPVACGCRVTLVFEAGS